VEPTPAQSSQAPIPTPSQTTSDSAAVGSILFAHNSVGQNIIDGMNAIDDGLFVGACDTPFGVGIRECTLGFNGDPTAKLAAFERMMRDIGAESQIAIFKLCYADFQADTDIDGLFEKYAATFRTLAQAYPDVIFVHMTAPLYAYDASWNNWVQHSFNEKLRANYGDLVFDLAALEALGSSGTLTVSRDGVTPALAAQWSLDGSHLNPAGSQAIARALAEFLKKTSTR